MSKRSIALLCAVLLTATMVLTGCAGTQPGSSDSGKGSTEQESLGGTGADKAADKPAFESGFEDIKFYGERYMARIHNCVDKIREMTDFKPDIAIVLGSGLGDFAEKIDVVKDIAYSEIEGFPLTTVDGHEGHLVFGTVAGKNVVAMQGRIHYYEGYSIYDVVLPLRVLHLLGAEDLILTNAVGAINADYNVGDFVLIKDHISTLSPSPLRGDNLDELGTRFPDMTYVYDKSLIKTVTKIAKEHDIPIHKGIFLQVRGPQYETPAEIRLYRMLGADTVGMSTVVEAIAARHMGMRICGISCVTNMAAGMEAEEISDDHIKEQADNVAKEFSILVTGLVEKM